MGKLQDGFVGGFSGRLGNVIGYNWRGRWCVRSLPADFKDARTDAQLRQRQLFSEMVRFAGRAKRILALGLEAASRNAGVTSSNYFIRINKGCFAMQEGELSVDLPELRLSDGPVAPVAFDAPQLLDEATISIDFEKNPLHRNCSQDDSVFLVAYCPEYKDFDFSDATARRRKQVMLRLNEAWVGKEVHLWGFVVDNARRASQSIYIGSGILGDFPTETDEDIIDFQENEAAVPTADAPVNEAAATGAVTAFAVSPRAAPPGGK